MINLKIKKYLPLTVTAAVLICTILFSAISNSKAPMTFMNNSVIDDSSSANNLSATNDNANLKDEEMKGVWVTYMELSMENEEDKSEKRFREKFTEIAENSKESGFNTLIVQVRPFCDALYESEFFPYSHILTGSQGQNPGYDALKIMCEICKSYDLKIHAWVNPYRVAVSKTPSELSDNNPYIIDNSLGFETEGGIYLDPSNEKTRQLIINGIEEIVRNYNVDGIQFDDYFYPNDISDCDNQSYEKYREKFGNNCMSIDDWRKANVNLLVSEVYRTVHKTKENVVFGISPQGNIDNNDGLYADVKSWCTCGGYIDYICPQIYFSIDNPKLKFEDSLESWLNLEFADNVTMYVGLAGYKAGSNKDDGTWLNSNDILATEYEILQKYDKVNGFMLYSYSSLFEKDAAEEVETLRKVITTI